MAQTYLNSQPLPPARPPTVRRRPPAVRRPSVGRPSPGGGCRPTRCRSADGRIDKSCRRRNSKSIDSPSKRGETDSIHLTGTSRSGHPALPRVLPCGPRTRGTVRYGMFDLLRRRPAGRRRRRRTRGEVGRGRGRGRGHRSRKASISFRNLSPGDRDAIRRERVRAPRRLTSGKYDDSRTRRVSRRSQRIEVWLAKATKARNGVGRGGDDGGRQPAVNCGSCVVGTRDDDGPLDARRDEIVAFRNIDHKVINVCGRTRRVRSESIVSERRSVSKR